MCDSRAAAANVASCHSHRVPGGNVAGYAVVKHTQLQLRTLVHLHSSSGSSSMMPDFNTSDVYCILWLLLNRAHLQAGQLQLRTRQCCHNHCQVSCSTEHTQHRLKQPAASSNIKQPLPLVTAEQPSAATGTALYVTTYWLGLDHTICPLTCPQCTRLRLPALDGQLPLRVRYSAAPTCSEGPAERHAAHWE
jgi:hypothetical protein